MLSLLRNAAVDRWDSPRINPESEPYRRPRILFFAPKECWPPDTGAKLRNYYLARDLAQEAEVTYLSFNDSGYQAAGRGIIDSGYEVPDALFRRTVTVRRPTRYKLSNVIRGAAGRTPLTVLNYTTGAMKAALSSLLSNNDYDIVQMESIHLANYLPLIRSSRSNPLVICDWHNIESELMSRYSQREQRTARRLYAKRTARRMHELEARTIPQFDAHLAVSHRDVDYLTEMGARNPVFLVENGVDLGHLASYDLHSTDGELATDVTGVHRGTKINHSARYRLLYVGSMDYHANEDAVVHFARDLWPVIRPACPNLIFTIVGRNPSPEVKALGRIPNIEVTGTVADVRPYYRQAVASLVPLRVGGGSRLKILEAMAAGVPVISTALGAEGLAVEDGRSILLAESGDDFRRAILRLSNDRFNWALLSIEGRRLVSVRYAWSSISTKLRQIHARLLSDKSAEFARGAWAAAQSGGFSALADSRVAATLDHLGGIK